MEGGFASLNLVYALVKSRFHLFVGVSVRRNPAGCYRGVVRHHIVNPLLQQLTELFSANIREKLL
jgi:hypothetical protein